jgi:hypothetical protein
MTTAIGKVKARYRFLFDCVAYHDDTHSHTSHDDFKVLDLDHHMLLIQDLIEALDSLGKDIECQFTSSSLVFQKDRGIRADKPKDVVEVLVIEFDPSNVDQVAMHTHLVLVETDKRGQESTGFEGRPGRL